MNTYVIGYDIRDPKRLVRVHRKMLNFGIPIEYSVFLLEGTPGDALRCARVMRPFLKLKEDDVRCYRLPSRGTRGHKGKKAFPAGITWTVFPRETAVSEMEPEEYLSRETLESFNVKEGRFFS